MIYLERTNVFHRTVNVITEYGDKRIEVSSEFEKKKWSVKCVWKKYLKFR